MKVLITGSSGGFGFTMAVSLAKAGHTVFASMRNIEGKNKEAADKLRSMQKDLPGVLHIVELDVSQDSSVNQAISMLLKKHGNIDVVINNAGIAAAGITESFTTDQLQQVFNVNYFGAHRVNLAVLPTMRRNKEGLIIHISSIAATYRGPFFPFYCGSKAAVECYVESLYRELAPEGIEVISVQPGFYATNIVENTLTGANKTVELEYAEIVQKTQQKFNAVFHHVISNAKGSQEVADAVVELVNKPRGSRPLRTVINQIEKHTDTMNAEYKAGEAAFYKLLDIDLEILSSQFPTQQEMKETVVS